MKVPLLNIEVRLEADIVLARQRARQIAALLGFTLLDQTRIATATSEIARNALQYAGGGRVEFFLESSATQALLIRIRERGMGIKDLQTILDGQYNSPSGLGIGITGARRLMDRFEIKSEPNSGVIVVMAKFLPTRVSALSPQDLSRLSAELARHAPKGLLEELQQQNQELLNALQELRDSQSEIAQMHSRELEETNRGVVALYAELDEGNKAIQRLSNLKSRFLSEMSHEFRSPLNSIKGLTSILLARTDGELSVEQEKQVNFIRQAADGLSTLVDDLLDVAKVEAGKARLRINSFDVKAIFENLQGTIRPMLDPSAVKLIFDEPTAVGPLQTDEGKVGQILRNFLTNAAKFTERGEIRVTAEPGRDDTVIFSVRDTGIGIAARDQDRIFEDFSQVENPVQKRVKGIGLGLPLTRKLASLLGGKVSVQSTPGAGSTFVAEIPRVCYCADHDASDEKPVVPSNRVVVLIQNSSSRSSHLNYLEDSRFHAISADTREGIQAAFRVSRPVAVVVDIGAPSADRWALFQELRTIEAARGVPFFILGQPDDELPALERGAVDFGVAPVTREWLVSKLEAVTADGPLSRALIIDDHERDRYLIKEALAALGRFQILESACGSDALVRASAQKPDVIFLDLVLPDMTGFEILDRLKSSDDTRHIPVIINSSQSLEKDDRSHLQNQAVAILAKGNYSREQMLDRVRESLKKAGLGQPFNERAE